MKMYVGVEVKLHPFVTTALRGCEWLASCSSCFQTTEKVSSTPCIGGWVGITTSLNKTAKRKF